MHGLSHRLIPFEKTKEEVTSFISAHLPRKSYVPAPAKPLPVSETVPLKTPAKPDTAAT